MDRNLIGSTDLSTIADGDVMVIDREQVMEAAMIVLGLLLILVAAAAAVFAVIAPTATSTVVELSALGVTVSASPLAMFVAGAGSVVLLGLGFALIGRGTRRSASSRKELRDLRREQKATDASRSAAVGDSSSRHDRLHESGREESTTDRGPDGSAGRGTESSR